MKKHWTIQRLFFGVLIFGITAFPNWAAEVVLEVPKTAVKPNIDGRLDDVWLNVPGTRMLKTCFNASQGWEDLSGTFRVMWDKDNIYLYVQAIDEEIRWDGLNSWDDDGIEFYFDADNSKGLSYDRVNDIQLRINYEWTQVIQIEANSAPIYDWGFSKNGIAFKFDDSEYGYDLEVKIPLTNLKLPSQSSHYFGFEMQFNDNDYGYRDDILKWWSESNDTWMNPSLFGTACLVDRMVSDTLDIPYANTAPLIDGVMDNAWNSARSVSLNHYTHIYSPLNNWFDCAGTVQLMWDEDFLYLFCSAVDQQCKNDGGNAWQNDGFEFYVDGNYSHGQSYDQFDDTQYIFCWNTNTIYVAQGPLLPAGFQSAQVNTSNGWQTEIAMPLNSIHIPPVNGHIFGMELVYNDDDDGGDREHQMHYWDADDVTYMQPSAMATAKLTGGPPPTIAYGDVDLNSKVQAYDASVILKYLVGMVQLNAIQEQNADVSLDGSVSALDASLILQYRVGLIDTLPYQSFQKIQNVSAALAFGDACVSNNGIVEIPLIFSETVGLCAIEGAVQFDPAKLSFETMNWAESFQSALSEIHCNDGKVRFACALDRESLSAQNVGVLRFKLNQNPESAETEVCLKKFRLNENPVQDNVASIQVATFQTGVAGSQGIPRDFGLHPNYPNPLNPMTTITYQLPKTCSVELAIYNLTGQIVETLVHGTQDAGYYSISWRATDMESGIYFYRLQADDRVMVRKMTVIK